MRLVGAPLVAIVLLCGCGDRTLKDGTARDGAASGDGASDAAPGIDPRLPDGAVDQAQRPAACGGDASLWDTAPNGGAFSVGYVYAGVLDAECGRKVRIDLAEVPSLEGAWLSFELLPSGGQQVLVGRHQAAAWWGRDADAGITAVTATVDVTYADKPWSSSTAPGDPPPGRIEGVFWIDADPIHVEGRFASAYCGRLVCL